MSGTKKRSTIFTGPNARFVFERRGALPPREPSVYQDDMSSAWAAWSGTQVTTSENHPIWRMSASKKRQINPDLTGDVGGDFSSVRRYVEYPVTSDTSFASSGWYPLGGGEEKVSFYGAILPLPPIAMPFPPAAGSSDNDLAALGSTAIARCAPTNSMASLATTLGELYKDGIPTMLGSSLWKARSDQLRSVYSSAGDEYLNAQFGWSPLVSDIVGISSTIINAQDKINQVMRDNGKVVRRRYTFPPVVEETETLLASDSSPSLVARMSIRSMFDPSTESKGKIVRFRTISKKRWFSGAFTYHLPDYGSGLVGAVDQARTLLGLNLDPELLWNLTPWSWAVDWFSNVGDVLHNVSMVANLGLVLRYGYIMEHTIASDLYSFSGPTGFKVGGEPSIVKLVTETKLRKRATPYGFGLTMGAFSNTQKAIVAALGLSRV